MPASIRFSPIGTRVHTLKGHDGSVYAVDFCPDGESIVTASWDATLIIWSTANGVHGQVDGEPTLAL